MGGRGIVPIWLLKLKEVLCWWLGYLARDYQAVSQGSQAVRGETLWHKPPDGHQYAATLAMVNMMGRRVWCPGPYERMSDNPYQG